MFGFTETGDQSFATGTTDANGHEVNRVLGGYKAGASSLSPIVFLL